MLKKILVVTAVVLMALGIVYFVKILVLVRFDTNMETVIVWMEYIAFVVLMCTYLLEEIFNIIKSISSWIIHNEAVEGLGLEWKKIRQVFFILAASILIVLSSTYASK